MNDLTWQHARPQAKTPLADALSTLSRVTKLSFHTLPVSDGRSLRGSEFESKYQSLFGCSLAAEITVGTPHFDSFFFPQGALAEAERLASEAFGAQDTLFITTGTTVSNQIAIEALIRPGSRVLLDKGTHQSIHFALATRQARIDYVKPHEFCASSERAAFLLSALVTRAAAAEAAGDPYELLVLNSQSYDGVMYNMFAVLSAVLDASPSLANVLVDEAWGAWSNFCPSLRINTALYAARKLRRDRSLNVVVTHSAHKSMSTLRQASYIHCVGDDDLGPMLRTARYRLHTTSPSYPILASLDLARAQMVIEGQQLTERSIHLANLMTETIQRDPALSCFVVNSTLLEPTLAAYMQIDPTKVSVDVTALSVPAVDLRNLLYRLYGLYVNRYTSTSLLFNFHIGVNEDDTLRLLAVLRHIQETLLAQINSTQISTSYLVPYPPGVPLVVPGEEVGTEVLSRLSALRCAGVEVFSVEER